MIPRWANRHSRAHRVKLVAGGLLLIILFVALRHQTAPFLHFGVAHPPHPREAAANATLGFEKLLVLSSKPSWRTRGLAAAAALTGLDFSIPAQPHNPEQLVKAFEHIGEGTAKNTPQHGSATAWIGHLDLLKYVIAAGFETAFIVEDDVDWDVRIKFQALLISDNVRQYTGVAENDTAPYGTDWDVLWLGHCGASFHEEMPPAQLYADSSRVINDNYLGWSKGYLADHVPDGHRQIQTSAVTVCSFGYGVTRASAQRILDFLGSGADEAFDVALSRNCGPGKLRCLVVNPQIMHHYEPPRELGYISPVDVGDGEGEAADETQFETVKGQTRNVVRSARCRALFHQDCLPLPPPPPPPPEGVDIFIQPDQPPEQPPEEQTWTPDGEGQGEGQVTGQGEGGGYAYGFEPESPKALGEAETPAGPFDTIQE